jgi:hypothetical protein
MGALKTGGQGSVYKGKRIAGIAETSTPSSTSGDVQINAQLNNAEKYLENGRVAEALPMYKI